MKIFTEIEDIPTGAAERSALTIGNFDGVHRGHQALLARTREDATELHGTSCALTFWPHPQEVLTGEGPELIATLDQRIAWIGEAGIDVLVVQPFDEAFSRLEPEEFLARIDAAFGLDKLVLGHDF